MQPRFYAGIGSRETPSDVLTLMASIAEQLANGGWTLRSGHALGADQAFEHGAGIMSEIYLPFPMFQAAVPIHGEVFTRPTAAAWRLASQIHPAWDRCTNFARDCHARNMHQVLGWDLATPVDFVICWARLDPDGNPRGGTAQAVRLARREHISVFNLVIPEHRARLERFVSPASALGV